MIRPLGHGRFEVNGATFVTLKTAQSYEDHGRKGSHPRHITDEETGDDDQRVKRPRRVDARPDYGKSARGMMLANVSLGNPRSRVASLFKRHVRLA